MKRRLLRLSIPFREPYVTSAGVAIQIGDVGQQIESPVVAPTTFAPFGGQLLVSSEFVDQVYAMSSTGTVSQVVGYESPEAAVFLPAGGACTFGRSGGAYFLANETTDEIVKFPPTDFTGVAGALVPSELSTTIGNMTTDGSTVSITDWQGALGGELESSTFFPCP